MSTIINGTTGITTSNLTDTLGESCNVQEVTAITHGVTTWDGMDYNDPDAVGTNATAKIYPDGTVIGSTNNGHYIKYPDGYAECSYENPIVKVTGSPYATSIYVNDAGSVSTPIALVSVIAVTPTARLVSGVVWGASYYQGASSIVLRLIGAQSTDSGYVGYTARGYWK